MEIQEFLGLCADRWLGLRTTYQLSEQKIDNSKSDIIIEKISLDSQELQKICQTHKKEPKLAIGALKTTWETSQDYGKPKHIGSTIVIWIPHVENPQTGMILQQGKSPQSLIGRYFLGKDEALTLTIEANNQYFEERIWFASPNLRLRTSLIKQENGWSQTAFYSEIRRVNPKDS